MDCVRTAEGRMPEFLVNPEALTHARARLV